MEAHRGIWFEKKRNRYRVRIYKNNVVAHRSYHTTEEEAIETYKAAKRELANMGAIAIYSNETLAGIANNLHVTHSRPKKLA